MTVRMSVNAFRYSYDEKGNEHFKQRAWGEFDFLFPPRVGDHLMLWQGDFFYEVEVKRVYQQPLEVPMSRPEEEQWGDHAFGWLEVRFIESDMNVGVLAQGAAPIWD